MCVCRVCLIIELPYAALNVINVNNEQLRSIRTFSLFILTIFEKKMEQICLKIHRKKHVRNKGIQFRKQ